VFFRLLWLGEFVTEAIGEPLNAERVTPIDRLSDTDDDVRSVSATCLLPILPVLSDRLSQEELVSLLDTLWNCFSEDGDELGSSTSAVMDLLCEHRVAPAIKLALIITLPSRQSSLFR
jgi:hypothetical protein